MTNQEYLKKVVEELSKPLEYKWKLQSYTKDKSKAMCVAYIDARIVIQRLNEVCVYGWHREHFALGNDKYCRLGVVMPDNTIIWRSDVGDSDNETETSKTAASDSFKRAAVQFGLGLFLYDLDIVKLPTKQSGSFYDVVDEKGNKIWDLTTHINGMLKKGIKKEEAPTLTKEDPLIPKKEWLNPNTETWKTVVKRMKESDSFTIDVVLKTFNISTTNKAKLIEETKTK